MAKQTPLRGGKPPKKRKTVKRPSARRIPPPRHITPAIHLHMPKETVRQELIPAPARDLSDLEELLPGLSHAERESLDARTIEDDDVLLGNLGLRTVDFTEAEDKVLDEPVPMARVRFLPQPVPVIYLPWQEYARLFNRALGRGKWQMVPATRERFDQVRRQVLQGWVLHMKGVPVAAATGQQDYHESNRQQSAGDALESTVASAMRRCAKRLGIWLELYDPDWKERTTRELGVCVKVAGKAPEHKETYAWRRRDDPPFYNEVERGSRSSTPYKQPEPQRPPPPAQTSTNDNPDGALPIPPVAVKQLVSRATRMGRTMPEVLVWLAARYGYPGFEEVKRRDYDFIMKAIESPGPLPLANHVEREPGED